MKPHRARLAYAATVVAAATTIAIPSSPVAAQSGLEASIQQYSASAIRGYLQPLANVLVANLSGGYHNGARLPSSGFSFSVELAGSLAQINDELRSYTASLPTGFQPATFQTPTIFGGSAPVVTHSSAPGISYRGSDGLMNGDYFPGAVPQLRLGGIVGTDVVVRWVSSSVLPYLDDADFPELTIFGVGARHSLSQYFPTLPLDLAVAGSFNSMTFGDIIDLSGTSFGLQVGRNVGFLGLYGGLSSDGGAMKVTYESTDPSQDGPVNTDIDAERSMRFTIGAALNIPVLKLFGDATFGGVTTYSFGLRIGT